MKQSRFWIVAAVLMFSACGNKSEETTTAKILPPSTEQSSPVAAQQPMQTPTEEVQAKANGGVNEGVLNYDDGLALAIKSGCLACHRIESKLVGPAWYDVSKRYKGDPDAKARLVARVKAGGTGNWTEVTGGAAMPANSPRVSDENIEKLVAFVLSL